MDFIDKELATYAEQHTSGESELLAKINRETYRDVLIPRMLSGHLQGRILSFFSMLKQPNVILEIGTYTGYSALCLAEGLTAKGQLHTIEKNEELEDRIQGYFNESQYRGQLHLHIGNALEIIPQLDKQIDLVFIDADKENYLNYYHLLIDKLPSGALIIADNVLWSGKVTSQEEREKDKDTAALQEFNTAIQNDPRVSNVLMPVRDGLMVIQKKK